MGTIKKIERSSKRRLMWLLARFLRARPIEAQDIRHGSFDSVLVIRQHNQMGDMILAIPALRAIRQSFPESRIGVVSSTLNTGVLQNSPFVDRLFEYNKRSVFSLIGMIRRLRRERYDLVIVLHTVSFSFTSLVLAVLSRARVRVGSTSRELGDSLTGSYLNLTLPLPGDEELAGMSETEHNLYPLRAIGVVTDDLSPVVVPDAGNDRWAESCAGEHWKPQTARLAVHPGAGKAENIWPPARHAEVVNRLARMSPVSLIVIEGPRDGGAVSAFQDVCDVPAHVVKGRSIGDVAALLRRADLVICNDTGVMHVAAAAGATTLAVFGPTDPHRWAPRAGALHVVRAKDGVLASLHPEEVAVRAAEILRIRGSGISSEG
ncbi:MAG: glycosyltransferase family 9 protein [Candidatus Latescibacterota bacterium]|jgi:ADP-heptose:LPS heptosyltransferase